MKTLTTGAAALAVAGAMLIAGCGGNTSPSPGSSGGSGGDDAGDVVELNFLQPLPKSISFYPLFVAEEMGFFEEEGLKVNLLPSGDVPVPISVVTGKADIGASITPDIIAALEEGEDLKLVYEHYQRNVFRIVVPEGSPIGDVTELKGKKVGVTAIASGDAALVQSAAIGAGLNPESDLELVAVGDGGPRVATSLKNGRIDAYAGALSDLVALEAAGIGFTSITPEDLDILPSSSFIVNPERGEQLAGPIGGFLRAWAKATYVGMVNPDVVRAIAVKQVPEEASDEKFAKLFVAQAVEQQTPVGGQDRFGELRPSEWTTIQEQLKAGGVIKEVLEPSTFLDDRFLQQANDWDRAEVEKQVEAWAAENL